MVEQMSSKEDKRSKFTLRTSDRRVFRRCLRKWNHMASMRGNWKMTGTEQNIHFWFGSGIHFALEDYHGYNKFKDPRRAFHAYYHSCKEDDLPDGAVAYYELAMAMLSYYIPWMERHNQDYGFETIWFDEQRQVVAPHTPGAVPAVEQKFFIPLHVEVIVDRKTDESYAQYNPDFIPGTEVLDVYVNGKFRWKGTNDEGNAWGTWFSYKDKQEHIVDVIPIYYHGTMDKMVIDRLGRWWILDYKTAKGADTNKLDTDDQISAYMWAAEIHFQHPIQGFIYHQLTKDAVQEPKRLKSGELSVDKKQKTTYSLLKQEIINDYGKVSDAPDKLIQFLNALAEKEAPEGDRFIRWDFVKRNRAQIETTYANIKGELTMMLSPTLHCYPNPTRDCIWECPIRDMCLAIDCQDQPLIDDMMRQWQLRPRTEDGNTDPWLDTIKWPESEDDLVPLEDIMDLAACMHIELDNNETNPNEFQFMYSED